MTKAVRSSGRQEASMELLEGICCIIRVLTCDLLTSRKDKELVSYRATGAALPSDAMDSTA